MHNHNGEQVRDLTDRAAFMWRDLGGVVIIDLAALVTEEIVTPDFCTGGGTLMKTVEPDLRGQGGTVNVRSSMMPFSHSVQHLYASQHMSWADLHAAYKTWVWVCKALPSISSAAFVDSIVAFREPALLPYRASRAKAYQEAGKD
jgi:hypothetical protein